MTGWMGGGATGACFGGGASPVSNRRNSSSHPLVLTGRGAKEGGGGVTRRGDAGEHGDSDSSLLEPVCCDWPFFLSHSQIVVAMIRARRIQKLSIRPNIGMANPEVIGFNYPTVWFANQRRPRPRSEGRRLRRCYHACRCLPGYFSSGNNP